MTKDFRHIKLLAYDFDGVMTDNRVILSEDGKESVVVNRSDGYAVSQIKQLGIKQIILSTEKNVIVERRAEKLGLEVIHGVDDKAQVLLKYCKTNGINIQDAFFIGNDLNDLSVMRLVGYRGAPNDAEKEVLEMADWISSKKGGYGVVRDLYDFLMEGLINGK